MVNGCWLLTLTLVRCSDAQWRWAIRSCADEGCIVI